MERFIESNQLFTYSTTNILQKTHPQSVKCTSHALKAFPRTMIWIVWRITSICLVMEYNWPDCHVAHACTCLTACWKYLFNLFALTHQDRYRPIHWVFINARFVKKIPLDSKKEFAWGDFEHRIKEWLNFHWKNIEKSSSLFNL